MLDQIRFIAAQNPDLDLARHPKVKIHFSRMGEPALNPAVLEPCAAWPRIVRPGHHRQPVHGGAQEPGHRALVRGTAPHQG